MKPYEKHSKIWKNAPARHLPPNMPEKAVIVELKGMLKAKNTLAVSH